MKRQVRTVAELRKAVEALPQPVLGLKGGVSRADVLALIDELERYGADRRNPAWAEPLVVHPGQTVRGRAY